MAVARALVLLARLSLALVGGVVVSFVSLFEAFFFWDFGSLHQKPRVGGTCC